MNKSIILNIPNILSFYRLFAFPFILWFALSGKEDLFIIFMIINFITDIADGFIARKFKMETDFGARLDSVADNFTYLLAFIGIFVFKLPEIQPHMLSFLLFAGAQLSIIIVSLIKFSRFPSFHLYSTKIGGYIQCAFFIVLFTYGFITPFYYFMIIWGIAAAIEHVAIQLVISEMRSNVKGFYWILKEQGN
jgi:cardiolipin synthase (CMP-forming)